MSCFHIYRFSRLWADFIDARIEATESAGLVCTVDCNISTYCSVPESTDRVTCNYIWIGCSNRKIAIRTVQELSATFQSFQLFFVEVIKEGGIRTISILEGTILRNSLDSEKQELKLKTG